MNPLLSTVPIQVYETVGQWLGRRQELKIQKRQIGFVPTMGALHAGHLALVQRALNENDFVLVSIFVNPSQFNNREDLELYPRTIKNDIDKLSHVINAAHTQRAPLAHDLGLLLPNENEIYADHYRHKVSEIEKSKLLCGAFRPGHFDGVLTVMMKLLGIAQADRCYMGEKDYQQFLLVKELAESFFLPTQILPHPTVREDSGLAMSSRNERLSSAGRSRAAILYKLLKSKMSLKEIYQQLEHENFKVEYVEERWGRRFAAVWLENVRLIDNVEI